ADPGAAHENGSLRFTGCHGNPDRPRKIGIIVLRVQHAVAEIDDLVSERFGQRHEAALEIEAGVIAAECDDQALRRWFRPAHLPWTSRSTSRATCSGVKPASFMLVPPGADAPKWSMPIAMPWEPMYRSQPHVEPASTDTRALIDAGSTDSRYSGACWSNSHVDGIETTRAAIPRAPRRACASRMTDTSEPLAIRIAFAPGASDST